MPAARLFVALGVVSLVLVGAVVEPRMGWAAVALDGIFLVLALVDHHRASRIPLAASRREPPLLTQGQSAPVEVEVEVEVGVPLEAAARRRGVVVELHEALHPALAEKSLRRRFRVPDGGRVVWQYELVPRARGECRSGPLTARVLGPWRLAWAQRELIPAKTRRVYPRVRWQGEVGRLLALARRRELGRSPLRLRGIGGETYALREYLKGDPPSKIHWKATARHGRLVTREETWEQGTRLVILLDCARTMASLADAEGGSARQSKLDQALAAALALTRVASGRGDRVTVIAFSDRIERVVRVGSGALGIRQAYEKLYDLPAHLGEPAYDVAVEEALRQGHRLATVVLFTSVVDLAASELMQESVRRLERRHRTLFVHLEDAELSALAFGAPSSPAEAFAKISAMEILLENRRLARRLRREGVRVVTTAADRLTLEALESYLALFRTRAVGVAV